MDEEGQARWGPVFPARFRCGVPACFSSTGTGPRKPARLSGTDGFAPEMWQWWSDGNYRMLGRTSVDIIKTGGYKVSALEIEEVLLNHPDVAECAVIGVEHRVWGEQVCAAIVPAGDTPPLPDALKEWAGARLAGYKVPRDFLTLEELPRNPMGKVSKPVVARLFREAKQ